ncbi:hypothetical protein RFZ44_21250, partial [Acinetobacter sp. 163]|nr:hypothetical protein [Acinetobacter sp. 163]
SCAPPSTIEVADTNVIFAFFCSSGIVSSPQLHIVDLTFCSDCLTLSLSLPAYGTYESTPSSKLSFLSPPIS